MSMDELQELVVEFRKTLRELSRSGCTTVPDAPCAPVVEAGPELSEAVPVAAAEVPKRVHSLGAIREDIGDCQRCALASTRQHIVFGCGREDAALLFVGEAPGAEEDRRALPFVGAAGELLDAMIVAMGWTRESVYIANVLKCRPPGNRDPKSEEVAACSGFLAAQIQAVAPSVIVTLGKPAAQLLLNSREAMGKMRGVWQDYQGIPVMPTYHPAYLLREPAKKREAWADLQQVMGRLQSLGIKPE